MELPINEEEIEFMELFYDPTALTECLMPLNENAPQTWDVDCECVVTRPYQFGMQNYSYLIAEDSELTAQEQMSKLKGAGDLYSIGSRNTGKSFYLKIDTLLEYIHGIKESCIASFDARHLKNVASPIALYIENHPFLQIFHLKDSRSKTVKRDPLNVITEHGAIIKGINEQVEGNEPGVQFHSLHYLSLKYEEASYMSEEGTKKRIDSGSSTGYVERLSGIPDLRIGSPLTQVLTNPKNKRKIWRLPQYVREDWCEATKESLAGKYGGESSNSYKLNVEAEILEGASGFWDMARLKAKALRQDRKIKYFEISKENFHDFENRIRVERLPGAEQVYIVSDIGLGHTPSEVIIIFRVGDIYKYVYQISLFKLIQKEQAQVFKWLYDKLGTGIIAHDATSDGGATIDELFSLGIPQEHLLKVKLNTNIEVDFQRDELGRIITNNNGEPLMKKVYAMDFAMQELENLMYSGNLEIAFDDKFLREFNSYFVKQTGLKKIYGSTSTDDLHQSIIKSEVVLCKVNEDIIVDTIENIYNMSENKSINVPTYNKGNLVWKPATLLKEKNKNNLIYDFKCRPGATIQATAGHSMLVWSKEKQQLIEALASDIKIGDFLLTSNSKKFTEFPSNDIVLDYKAYNRSTKEYENYQLELTEDLAYLFGMFCAEGFSCQRGDSVILYCGDDEPLAKQILKKATAIFNQFKNVYNNGNILIRPKGTKVSDTFISKSDFFQTKYYGRKINEFFIGWCGKGAKNKKVPYFLYKAKDNIVEAFLDGLLTGDGNKQGKLTTTSRALANGVLTLYGKLGYYSAFYTVINKHKSIEYYINKGTKDNYYRNIPYAVMDYSYSKHNKSISREKLQKRSYKFAPQLEKVKNILSKVEDFNFVQVQKISTFTYDDYVYDFSVPETNNFIAGVGNVVVHNSFQVFGVAKYFNEDNPMTNKKPQTRCYGVY